MAKTPMPETVPTVGMGATMCGWSDRHAYTVCEVVNPRKCFVQKDRVKRIDSNGMSECQEWDFTPNPEAARVLITFRKDGRWHEGTTLGGTQFAVGHRSEYYDFSF